MEKVQPQATSTPRQAPANTNAAPENAPFDASWFLRDNRIHVEDGSHFFPQNYLMVRPEELAPENQQRFFAKLVKHLSLPAPSIFEFYPRNMVMFALGSYLPISKESRLASLKDQSEKLKKLADGTLHPDGQDLIDRYLKPLQSNVKMRREEPDIDPVDKEYLTQSLALYLVINEALGQQKRPNEPASYISNLTSADGVLADLTRKLGLRMSEFVEIAQTRGIEGIGEKLGVPAQTVQEIRQVAEKAAEHHYADNVVMNWDAGRQTPGTQGRSIDEKMAVGLLQRAGGLLGFFHQTIPADQPKPDDVLEAEKRVLATIREWPEALQKAYYYSGAEFGYVSAPNLAGVSAELARAGGVNIHIPYETGGENGLRMIINSSLNNRGYSRKVSHHEAHHLFSHEHMNDDDITKLETLMKDNSKRLHQLRDALDKWYVQEEPDAKRALAEDIDRNFKVGTIGLKDALAADSKHPISPEKLLDAVDEAIQNLDFDSPDLTRGYPMPELRAAEVISRFAELYYVKMADNIDLLGFVCPQLMVGYHDIYLPHVERFATAKEAEQAKMPEQLRYLGLPPDAANLPATQPETMALGVGQEVREPVDDRPKAPPESTIAASTIAAQMPAGAAKYLDRVAHQGHSDLPASAASLTR